MKYDFTSIMDRHGKDAIAVDGLGTRDGFAPEKPEEGFDVIPMWVADMNFPTVPTVPEAIIRRAEHPAYGYFDPTDEYFDAIIQWQEKRNGVTGLRPEHIGYENGVLGGVISALNVFCSRGDNVLVHQPTYIGFTKSLKITATTLFTARWFRMKTAYGAWTMRTWRKRLLRTESMRQFCAALIIHAAVYGRDGNWNGQWNCIRSTMFTLFLTRSGLT